MIRTFKKRLRRLLEKLHLMHFVDMAREWQLYPKVVVCRRRYAQHIQRLREFPRDRKIKVLFVVSEIAKWKEQRVYEQMERSGFFEPVVGISAWNRQLEDVTSNVELVNVHRRAADFFARLGDRYVFTVTIENGVRIHHPLSEFHPDIVYYTEPYGPCPKQDPFSVSEYALTIFTPYFTPNYGILEWDCHRLVHRLVYAYTALNEAWCKVFERSLRITPHVARFIPVGHPALDFFANAADYHAKKNFVIYAPHYSFPNPKCPEYDQKYSTFDWNHKEILDYAKMHSEINWVFKPHPLLREWVKSSGLMSEERLNAYFDEWRKIGIVCEDGDYQQLFLESRALITDCGSFLTEYGSTGRPVIHLICSQNRHRPIALMRGVYETYYQVHDLVEMKKVFKDLLEDRKDVNQMTRLQAVKAAGILNSNAAENIVAYILDLIGR